MTSAPRIRAALGIALLATSFCLFLLLVAAASAAGIHGGIVLGSAPPVETVFHNSGSPWPFLNQVAAVNCDNGGQGLGYNVSSTGCSGAACTAGALAYRPDDVNFKAVTGVTGFPRKLGFNVPTAAYNYSVTVATTGRYQLNLLGTSGGTGGTLPHWIGYLFLRPPAAEMSSRCAWVGATRVRRIFAGMTNSMGNGLISLEPFRVKLL